MNLTTRQRDRIEWIVAGVLALLLAVCIAVAGWWFLTGPYEWMQSTPVSDCAYNGGCN